ncbi:MAG: hypothetical protein J5J00_09050 [Deltaproteobacteria bacterium]|nr:hypothetical protein [Deltaproteobacteria bacterium]
MQRLVSRELLAAVILLSPLSALAQSPADLPLLSLSDFEYAGAFRLPADQFGSSSLNYSEGPIEYNPARNSIYIVGHNHHQEIAEFQVPELVQSTELEDLNMAGAPLQQFSDSVLGRASQGNSQNINRIGGLRLISGALVVNAYEYYDADGNANHTTLVVRDADSLDTSAVNGYYSFMGGAGHTSGWISPVPSEWQSLVGSAYITGQSSGIPIISRTSVGPSAFAFDPASLLDSGPGEVPTVRLLDFSLDNPLHSDLSNDSRSNDAWTHLSRATYGFIAPGSRTYVTIGSSGGHNSGVCYKCTPSGASQACGGYCARNVNDNNKYYWLWDVNDLVAVKAGQKASHSVRPYEYGVFPAPFNSDSIGGGSFDPASGLLYLSVQGADDGQGAYSNPPVIVAYRFNPDPGNGGGGGGGGGGSPKSAIIGRAGNFKLLCVEEGQINMVRFDKLSQEGELRTASDAITFIKKKLAKARAGLSLSSKRDLMKKRYRSLKRVLRKTRKCSTGSLPLS